MTRIGLPHSEIFGLKCICHYPKLIAAYHVLHRLLMPRHPSYARIRLAEEFYSRPYLVYVAISLSQTMQFSKIKCRLSRRIFSKNYRCVILRPHSGLNFECKSPICRFTLLFASTVWLQIGGRAWNRTRDFNLIRVAL